jgi:catalase
VQPADAEVPKFAVPDPDQSLLSEDVRMSTARSRTARVVAAFAVFAALVSSPLTLAAQEKSLPQQIADVMVQLSGGIHPGFRFTHAKGLVLTGSFTPARSARSVSRAAHLTGGKVPVTVRFSDGTGNPQASDANPATSPRGMAIRFTLPKGGFTDIVSNSHNGFFVGTGTDFLAFLKAVAATTPTSPHPSPIEQFLGAHPRALKVVQESQALPKSFANLDFYGNNAFVFVDSAGVKRAGRYQIIPVAGVAHLDSAAAAKAGPNYLFDDLRHRVARGPIAYRLFVQLANPGDPTHDGSIVWPADRKRVMLGTLTLISIAPDNEALQRKLAYSPIYLTDGIQLSDDPFPTLRAAVYALSVQHRAPATPNH